MLCFIATRGGSETAGLGYLRARLPGLGVAQGSQGGGLSLSPSVCSWGCLSRSVFSASLTASAGIPYEGPSWDMLPATTLLSWPGTKRCHPQTAPLLVHKPEASCAVSPFHRFFWLRGKRSPSNLARAGASKEQAPWWLQSDTGGTVRAAQGPGGLTKGSSGSC